MACLVWPVVVMVIQCLLPGCTRSIPVFDGWKRSNKCDPVRCVCLALCRCG